MTRDRVIVVGGGLAGLMATIRAAEMGVAVDLFSIVPVKRSHSVCAQGGINGAVNTKGEGDSPEIHFDDTIYGGDFLADQPPVKAMCYAAPGIINLLDRMGVMFNRTPEGLLDFRRFGGHAVPPHRLRRRDDRAAAPLRARRAGPPLRGGGPRPTSTRCGSSWASSATRTATAAASSPWISSRCRSRRSAGMAVMLATGGPGIVFGRSTNSVINTGTAAAAAYQEGARYANGEFIQVHPTAIPGERQAAADVRVGPRRGRPRVGSPGPRRQARSASRSRSGALVLPGGEVSGLRQPRPARHRHPRDLPDLPHGLRRRTANARSTST